MGMIEDKKNSGYRTTEQLFADLPPLLRPYVEALFAHEDHQGILILVKGAGDNEWRMTTVSNHERFETKSEFHKTIAVFNVLGEGLSIMFNNLLDAPPDSDPVQ